MAQDLIMSPRDSRRFQAPALLVAALLQIAFARVTDLLQVGQNVEVRSALTSHPLVPWGYAFIIWGVIYAYALGTALWQLGPNQRHNRALRAVGWQTACIYLINAVWQIWVPLHGFDVVSVAVVAVSLFLGISSLMRLKSLSLSRKDELLVAGPLALVTGWLTAACFVNFTSFLVATHATWLNPLDTNVSLIFLVGLIAFAGVVVAFSHSLLYSLAIMWALFWVMMANIYRDHEFSMATVALVGILLVAAITGRQLYESGHRGEPMHA